MLDQFETTLELDATNSADLSFSAIKTIVSSPFRRGFAVLCPAIGQFESAPDDCHRVLDPVQDNDGWWLGVSFLVAQLGLDT